MQLAPDEMAWSIRCETRWGPRFETDAVVVEHMADWPLVHGRLGSMVEKHETSGPTEEPATLSGVPADENRVGYALHVPTEQTRVLRYVQSADTLYYASVIAETKDVESHEAQIAAWFDGVRFADLDAVAAVRAALVPVAGSGPPERVHVGSVDVPVPRGMTCQGRVVETATVVDCAPPGAAGRDAWVSWSARIDDVQDPAPLGSPKELLGMSPEVVVGKGPWTARLGGHDAIETLLEYADVSIGSRSGVFRVFVAGGRRYLAAAQSSKLLFDEVRAYEWLDGVRFDDGPGPDGRGVPGEP